MKNKLSIAMSLALIMAMLVTSLAVADNVENDVVTVPASISLQAGVASSYVDVQFYVQPNSGGGDPDPQCNFDTATEKVTFTINTPSGVTANPVSLTFNECKEGGDFNYQVVRFSANVLADSGNISFTETFNNSGGTFNYANAVFYVNVLSSDTTPPVITPYVVGTLGVNGWYTGDVTVSWSVSDPESTPTYNCPPATIDYDSAGVTLTCSASSAGGNSSESVTIKRDATVPTISGSASPAPNGVGWNNTDVTASFTCGDSLSGIASCGPVQTLSSEGASQSVSGTAVDNAGNSASATVGGINIDKTAPSASANASPAPNANGWNNSDVTVSFSGSDGLSGIASCSAPVVLSSEGAGQSVSGNCTDLAGNSASAMASGINIDKTAPVIFAALDKTPAGSGWFNISTGVPTVSFTCSDALSGLNGDCPANHIFGDGEDQAYSQTIYDLAGNSASAGVSNVDVDTVMPSISASVSPAMPLSGWWNIASGAPTVTYTCSDGTSGLASCSAPFTFPEGADQSHTGTAVDNAGNSATESVNDIDVDLTGPTIILNGGPADGASYYFGFVPPPPFGQDILVSDNLSGPNVIGVLGYSSEVGMHTLTVTAYDYAGNESSISRTYTVLAWTLNGFYKPVDMSGIITVWNTVKGGSTVPLKFEVFAGTTELTDTTAVKSLSAVQVSCTLGWEDSIETIVATGGTSLRYDWNDGQFIYNWQTPKKAGNCYKVTMTTQDGSFLSAFFKLK